MLDESDAVKLITKEAVERSATKLVPAGSILVGTRVGVGKVGVNAVPMCTSQDIVSISDIDDRFWNKEYVCLALQYEAPRLVAQAQGATITGITSRTLREVTIPTRKIADQTAIVTKLNSIKKSVHLAELQISHLQSLVKSRFVEMFGDPATNSHDLPIERLSDLGVLERGKSKHRPRNAPELRGGPNGPYPLVQTGDITNAGLFLSNYEDTYTEIGLRQSRMWPKGTLCITIAANIAQTSILAIDACFPDSVVGFTPGPKIQNVFLHYWFGFFQGILEEQAPQAAQKNINLKILSELDVITPSIEEQQEFAAFVRQAAKLEFVALVQYRYEFLFSGGCSHDNRRDKEQGR